MNDTHINNDHIRNNTYTNKNRQRKIIWLNSPFYQLSNVDIGKYFKKSIDKHFEKDNPLSKVFNRSTVKISYSCINIFQIIYNHNKKLLDNLNLKNKETHKPPCNYRIKENGPIDGNCNQENVVYQANIFSKEGNSNEKAYIVVSPLKWKFRYYNHSLSFNNS